MATLRSFFSTFVLLLLHLACFHIFASAAPTRNRKQSPNSPSRIKKAHKAISSSWSSLKSVFSSKFTSPTPTPTSTSASSQLFLVQPEAHSLSDATKTYEISDDSPFLPLRNDTIFPCAMCGEVFPKAQVLEQHESTRHAVSEMRDSDAGKNIVRIIFGAGWTETRRVPEIHRILKIRNSRRIMNRFEEYREMVKSKAARYGADQRCVADGNEVLRFQCATFCCNLGQNGNSSICGQKYCSVCGIVRSGFSGKADGIATLAGSWRAHVSLPEDVEEEFSFMNLKRAVLVCRVVAGRVGCETDDVDKGDAGFDSRIDGEELLVFNPKAVLPCFVIVYTVVDAS